MNYVFNRDVTIKFKCGRMISDESVIAMLRRLLVQGYTDEVSDEVYDGDVSEFYEKTHENGVPLDELETVAAYREAFRKRRIKYDPMWRRADFSKKAHEWCETLIRTEMKERRRARRERMKEKTLFNGEEY